MDQITGGMLMMGVGALSIIGALLNWRIVVGSGKLIPRLLGPTGAKIFMVILGIGFIGYGIALIVRVV
jgi:hypothetical protein